jgi:hypothetical protein
MKHITRSEVERAVVECFKICHKDLDEAAIQKEVDERMERLKARALPKPKKDRSIFGAYLRNKSR